MIDTIEASLRQFIAAQGCIDDDKAAEAAGLIAVALSNSEMGAVQSFLARQPRAPRLMPSPRQRNIETGTPIPLRGDGSLCSFTCRNEAVVMVRPTELRTWRPACVQCASTIVRAGEASGTRVFVARLPQDEEMDRALRMVLDVGPPVNI